MITKLVTYFANISILLFVLNTNAVVESVAPCHKQIDKCIKETRNSDPAKDLGGCLGTAYGLYFAGEENISSCKDGNYTANCLEKDQEKAIFSCVSMGFTTFPKVCTDDVWKCIQKFPAESNQ